MDDKEHDPDYWGQLAEAFNDYERNYYGNITCLSEIDQITFMVKNIGPAPGHESAWELCQDIDPTLGTFKRPLRDAAWVKEQFRTFKSSWILIYNNYKASGHHDAEYSEAEFNNYTGGKVIYLYAFVLFNETDMTLANSMMGKTLPNYASNDSGILNDSESCDTPKSLKTSKAYNKKALDIDTTSSTKNKIYVEHTVQSPGSLSTSPRKRSHI